MRFLVDMNLSPLTVTLGGYDRPSLVTLRLLNTDPPVVTQRLRQVLPQLEAVLSQGCGVTVEDRAVRVRRLPIR